MKNFVLFFYKHLTGIQVLINFSIYNKKNQRVFYGGARKGNIGGTLVKIKRLMNYFPKKNFFFNLVYVLSNSPYLPKYALNLLKKRKIPIIHNQNGVFYPAWYNGNYKKMNKIMALQYNRADYIFFQSQFCKFVAEKFLGKCNCNNEILYNAVDTSFFIPRKNHDFSNTFIMLITGKFNEGHYYHLKNSIVAIKKVTFKDKDIKFHIAGKLTRRLYKKINNLIINLNLKNRIKMIGTYKQSNANFIYQKADAFIYMAHNAPCPNSVIEAMSSGLPILYSNSGGLPELVGIDCGVPLEVENNYDYAICPTPDKISEGIVKIIVNHKKFSQNSRKKATTFFSIEKWIERHRIVFENLLKNEK